MLEPRCPPICSCKTMASGIAITSVDSQTPMTSHGARLTRFKPVEKRLHRTQDPGPGTHIRNALVMNRSWSHTSHLSVHFVAARSVAGSTTLLLLV